MWQYQWKHGLCSPQAYDNIKLAWCFTTLTSACICWRGVTLEQTCSRVGYKNLYFNSVLHQMSFIPWFSQITPDDIYSLESLSGKIFNALEFCASLQNDPDKIRSAPSFSDSAPTKGDKEQRFRSSGCQIDAIVENEFKTTPGVQEGW